MRWAMLRSWFVSRPQLALLGLYFLLSLILLITGIVLPLQIGIVALCGTLIFLIWQSRLALELMDLLPTLAILCMWVAPALLYFLQKAFPNYAFFSQMPVSEASYFSIAIPAVLAIGLGSQVPRVWSFKDDLFILEKFQQQLAKQPLLPALLIGIGCTAYFVNPYLPIGWAQFGHYMSQLMWIGGLHALMSSKFKWINGFLVLFVFFMLIRDALYSTMFGKLVFWIIFALLYLQVAKQWAFWKLILGGLLGFLLLVLLLTFKYNYRGLAEAEGGSVANRILLFGQALQNRLKDPFGDPWNLQQPLHRINHGYHLALTYQHVPAREPFAKGETIKIAFISAFIPRLFWQDKPKAGGKENYPRFTGIQLLPGVSTNIGPAGDAYVNFGRWGGAVFLFFYAFTLRLLYDVYRWLATNWYAPILLWLPIIYINGVSVEKDVLTTWNDAVKGTFFILGCCGILYFSTRKLLVKNNISSAEHVR